MVKEITENNIDNEQLGVEFLCREIGMSRTQLHRKLNGISEVSAVQLIQDARLVEAQKMLKQGFRVSETAYKVVYNSQAILVRYSKKNMDINPKSIREGRLDTAGPSD